jgi:hypothetical protein
MTNKPEKRFLKRQQGGLLMTNKPEKRFLKRRLAASIDVLGRPP